MAQVNQSPILRREGERSSRPASWPGGPPASRRRRAHPGARRSRRVLGLRHPHATTTAYYRDKLIPIDRHQGALIYLLCRSIGARRVVEYGTSSAYPPSIWPPRLCDNGEGVVIGTELEPFKVKTARENFATRRLGGLRRPARRRRSGDAEGLRRSRRLSAG